jgi:hypothetical protein
VTTAPSGSCTAASSTLKNTVPSTNATVTAVSGSGMTYDSTKNAASAITITRQ